MVGLEEAFPANRAQMFLLTTMNPRVFDEAGRKRKRFAAHVALVRSIVPVRFQMVPEAPHH